MEFYKYPAKPWDEVLKGASSNGRDLVSKLVRYESSQRLSAVEVSVGSRMLWGSSVNVEWLQALDHPFFSAS